MSVELPPLPAVLFDERGPLWEAIDAWYYASSGEQSGKRADAIEALIADQMHAYATEALAAQSAELAECKEAYALLFKENARLREEVEKRKPLSEAELLACVRESRDMTMYEFARAIERAHGIGKQE